MDSVPNQSQSADLPIRLQPQEPSHVPQVLARLHATPLGNEHLRAVASRGGRRWRESIDRHGGGSWGEHQVSFSQEAEQTGGH